MAYCQEYDPKDSNNDSDFSVSYKSNKILVAAIDFGTTFSGYAFSFKSWFETDPNKIVTNSTWVAGQKNLISLKTPTCILLQPNKSFHSFGYEAEEKYAELALEEEHEDWYFFKRFKMSLFNNTTLSRHTEIPDDSGNKKMPAQIIFSHGIRFLKNHLVKHLESSHTGLNESDIHWVLTVPAIWNDSAKQFMREAASQAGIKDTHLMISLEPEAAAMYCRILPVEKFVSGGGGNLGVFKPGSKYMVADLGGGTVDITVQEVLEKDNLKELHKASGGAWGGTKVDENFMQMIVKVVGEPVIQRFKCDSKSDELDLLREFEIKKRSIRPDATGKTAFRIPISLTEAFEEINNGADLRQSIKQTPYAKHMNWVGDKLKVDNAMIKELFTKVSDSIVQHLKDILNNPVSRGVDTILMVGGFSECAMIQEAIKTNFSHMKIIIPEDAGLAVVKGAVLFGHNPATIVSRKAKYTYGVKITRDFKEGDPQDKKYQVNGRNKCSDVFSKHVEIGETVKVGESLNPQSYFPLHSDVEEVVVPLYISTDEDPSYTTEPSCNYLGKIVVPLKGSSVKDKEIVVQMTFGGTEMTVEAEEKKSSKKLRAKFDFLDH
ncbi:heat shock 70 kDa protein 12B-like [Mytilus trossulus]|uniref:heat shock 70 kDa protein 12B-like n=1 Tax=Mytilus trossulus TaxID=6551 RepID=UPI0030067F06